MRYYVTLPGREELAVDVVRRPGGKTEVHVAGAPIDVDVVEAEGALSVRVGARVFDLWLETDGKTFGFVGAGVRARAVVDSERSRIAAAASRSGDRGGGGAVVAPMPGRVVKILVGVGDVLDVGAPVIVVEAMKMENELSTDKPGVVARILVTPGASVDGGATLVELDPIGKEDVPPASD